MKKIYKSVLLCLLSTTIYSVNNIISLTIQQYPMLKNKLDEEQVAEYSKKLTQPGYLYRKIVKNTRIQTGVRGIMGIYLGFTSLTDYNGQMIFPRKQQKSEIKFLITKSIKPIYIVAPETIHNWMLDPQAPAQMYTFSLKEDKKTDLYYIDTKKTSLPINNMISLDTIILIADPKYVYIPEGATITHKTPNLILPNIYIRKNFNFWYNALYTLSIKQYFEQINQEYKHEDQSVAMIIK